VSVAVTLLGPQRRPTLDKVLAELDVTEAVAFTTAGWQERESEDGELAALLGGRGTNLRLHARWLDVLEADPEFSRAEREHRVVLDELQQLYLVRLDHALQATTEVARRVDGNPRTTAMAVEDSLEIVRLIDRTHLARVQELHAAFYDAWPPHERDVVEKHREEVRAVLAGAQCLVIAGGHVGELVQVLHLFNVAPDVPQRVVAWSAGAMALTERVVLFHDRAVHGPAQTEVLDAGIGLAPGLVLLPHARRRLRTDDPVRMAVFARRFSPARCVVLADAVTVHLGPGGRLPADAQVVSTDGVIVPAGDA
jgi:hypothetical protein